MGAAAQLVIGGSAVAWTLGLAAATLLLQVFVPYSLYVRYLKWLTFSLFAYVAVALLVHAPLGAVLRGALVPTLGLDKGAITLLVAVFGTTISPYLFFWQSSEEVEEMARDDKPPLVDVPRRAGASALRRLAADTVLGMLLSNVISFCIILSAAATLHAHGQTSISSADQAAEALRPLAGPLTFALFALGVVGTGLLAIPVLAGSVAYACAECFGWRASLEERVWKAPRFYAVLAGAIVAGLGILVLHVDPITALVWSAVVNGLAAVPLMVMVVLLASRRRVMKAYALPPWLQALGWLATAVMAAAAAGMLWTTFA
jgi:Mn2+/Fe2+ NRAMP family transporter